jgi:MFS family permease
VYLIGLLANLVSMALLIVSQFVAGDPIAYGLLLAATACLGMGFGLTAPTLNILTAVFHPTRVDTSVLTLNALLGLGTALAPVFVAIFVGLGFWWGLPLLSAVLLTGLLVVSSRLPLRSGARDAGERAGAGAGIPTRFWLFAAFAILYGICETMNGNWAQLEMTGQLGASVTLASLALTTFWAMVTAGGSCSRASRNGSRRGTPTVSCRSCWPLPWSPSRCSLTTPRPLGSSHSGWPAWAARRCCRSPSASARRSSWARPRWPAA